MNGVFVDIGANDGVNLSNSYFFERHLAWTGLCIEPNPEIFQKLRQARTCACVEACATTFEGSGRFNFFSGSDSVYGRLAQGGEQESSREISVQCREINTLLAEHNLKKIDYLSIDIEGNEMNLFAAIDLSRFEIDVVSMEENNHPAEMDQLMEERGYRFLNKIGCDRIYQRR